VCNKRAPVSFPFLLALLLLLSLRKEEKNNALTCGRRAVGLLDVAGDDGRKREREKSLGFSRIKIRDAKECEHLHAGFEMRISD
jgi:hypothetical protein